MAIINLRQFYAFYTHDEFVEVSDSLADELKQWERDEKAYRRKKYWHHAHYSLDRNDGIENSVLFIVETPDARYERHLTQEQLYTALLSLPDKQAKRIYAHFFHGLSKADIARAEGVGKVTVGESISRGLQHLELYLQKDEI